MAASGLDTRLIMQPLRNTERLLDNAAVERLLEKERTTPARTLSTASWLRQTPPSASACWDSWTAPRRRPSPRVRLDR